MTTTPWTIERQVHFRHAGHGRGKQVHEGQAPNKPNLPAGRVPRVSKLMALALHCDDLLRSGAIGSYAELARLASISTEGFYPLLTPMNLAKTACFLPLSLIIAMTYFFFLQLPTSPPSPQGLLAARLLSHDFQGCALAAQLLVSWEPFQ